MTVHRAQRPGISVGGHISSYASSATLYEVGFNHFFRGKDHPGGGDQVYFQGHASPGIYARAYLEGRLSEDRLDGFRQELSHGGPGHGLPSYPHPRLMPDFWEFPTVSMGLGPMNAIMQARFNRYLGDRGISDTADQRVWAFLGDGEMDEPESRGLIHIAATESLDNLTFVVNCNLQRLDGPVRGNGKIIQELEAFFRGAGWNVIKVIWGREWDALLHADRDGALINLMNTDAGRGLPDLQGQRRRLRPRPLLRARPAHQGAGRADVGRRDLEPQARRPRLPQGLRRLRRGAGAHRAAHRHPREDDQGIRAGHALRGPQRHAPDEEALAARPQGVPRLPAHPDLGQGAGGEPLPAAVLPPWRGRAGDPVHARAQADARRAGTVAPGGGQAAAPAGRQGLRRRAQGVGQAGGRHDDGVRPVAARAGEGPRDRRPVRADHPGRGQDVRHGLHVPDAEDLQPERAAVHVGRRVADAGLPRVASRANCCTRGSTRRARSARSRRPAPRTPRTASR